MDDVSKEKRSGAHGLNKAFQYGTTNNIFTNFIFLFKDIVGASPRERLTCDFHHLYYGAVHLNKPYME